MKKPRININTNTDTIEQGNAEQTRNHEEEVQE